MKSKILKSCLSLILGVLILPSAAAARGGGSDGGGNSYQGKPLESYAKDPMKLAAYQKLILPLLKDIKAKEVPSSRMDVLAHLVQSVFSQKIWYFVPGPLDHIPAELLNSAVRTEQAVLQGHDRVWIDEDIWKKMEIEDQTKLLLHEAFMGLKILRFGSSFRQCLAAYLNSENCRQSGRDSDLPIDLQTKDYVDVQRMTIKVSQDFHTMTDTDWVKELNQNGFKFAQNWFEITSSVSVRELEETLKKSALTGYLPTQGYDLRSFDTEQKPSMTDPHEIYEYFQAKKEACQIKAEVVGNALDLRLQSKSDSLSLKIPLPEELNTQYSDWFLEGRNLKMVAIPGMTGEGRATGGYTLYNVWLGFDSFRLAQVYVQEMVCEKKDCSTNYYDVRGGLMFVCSDNAHLFKPKQPSP